MLCEWYQTVDVFHVSTQMHSHLASSKWNQKHSLKTKQQQKPNCFAQYEVAQRRAKSTLDTSCFLHGLLILRSVPSSPILTVCMWPLDSSSYLPLRALPQKNTKHSLTHARSVMLPRGCGPCSVIQVIMKTDSARPVLPYKVPKILSVAFLSCYFGLN